MDPRETPPSPAGELPGDGSDPSVVFVIDGRRWVARTEMYIQPFDDAELWSGASDRRVGADRRRGNGPWQGEERRQSADRRQEGGRRQGD